MKKTITLALGRSLAIVAAAALFAACADQGPLEPKQQSGIQAQLSKSQSTYAANARWDIATLRRVTARYHDLNAALNDGFTLLHECESRPGEGPVGIVYYNPTRLMDGRIDPALPDALIYEPTRRGRPRLVGVEFAVPYPLWTGQEPPRFHGATFQREDEFGVFALHAWVWLANPRGLFAETNPRVSCGAETE